MNLNSRLQIFAVSLECAMPFIDNFRIIHSGADQRFSKKVLVIVDTETALSHRDVMAILRHDTVINGLPFLLNFFFGCPKCFLVHT